MNILAHLLTSDVVGLLQSGGVGVIRTDTLYGIVAQANNEAAVSRVYRLKDRDEAKSPIILIGSIDQLFDIPSHAEQELVEQVWPGKTSVILSSTKAPQWIQRENNSVAYRLPDNQELQQLLLQTGPLIAPSANPESHVPAMSVDEAVDYFGDQVDFYVDGGTVLDDTPSRLLRLNAVGMVERLR